jgi:hypothetical protein
MATRELSASALVLLTILSACLLGCATATVTHPQDAAVAGAPVARPAIVLVRDFELDAAEIRSEPGLVPHPILGHTMVGGLLHGTSACSSDEAAGCAHELRELIASSLVSDLNRAGLNAQRIGATDPLPARGWLVRGVFTDVDSGNRLHRAVIGFGSGATQMQLVLSIDDVAQGVPKPLYKADASATSGNAPGAAVLLNPIAMGARFVMSRDDLDKSAKKLAEQVSAEIARRAGVPSGG